MDTDNQYYNSPRQPRKANYGLLTIIIAFILAVEFTVMAGYQFYWHFLAQTLILFCAFLFADSTRSAREFIVKVYVIQVAILFAISQFNSVFGHSILGLGLINIILPLLLNLFFVLVVAWFCFPYGNDFLKSMTTQLAIAFVIVLLGLVFGNGLSNIFNQFAHQTAGIHFILMHLVTSIWFLWSLSHASEQSKFFKFILFIYMVFLLIVIAQGIAMSGILSEMRDEEVDVDYRTIAAGLWTTAQQGVSRMVGYWNQREELINATTQRVVRNFEVRVENSAIARDMGVSIDRIERGQAEFMASQPVFLFSAVRAVTVDKPIPIELSCSAGQNIQRASTPGVVQRPNAWITSIQSHQFVCEFPANTFDQGTYQVRFDATFNFTSSSYVTRYVMDNDRYTALKSQNIDPFVHYSISNRNPVPIYTPGPVIFGISTINPMIVLQNTQPTQLNVQLRFDPNNRWDGRLEQIHELAFMVPKGFEVARNRNTGLYECTQPIIEQLQPSICDPRNPEYISDCDQYNAYVVNMSGAVRGDTHARNNIIVACTVEASTSSRVLGNQPLRTISFRAYTHYGFTISQSSTFRVIGFTQQEQTPGDGIGLKISPHTRLDRLLMESMDDFFNSPKVQEAAALMDEKYFPVLVGIVHQARFTFDYSFGMQDPCVGNRCGITRYTPQMYAAVQGSLGEPYASTPFTQLTNQQKDQIAVRVASLYINEHIIPQCANQEHPLECIAGKYECGLTFVHMDYYSCSTLDRCYFCNDFYINQVMSLAVGFHAATQ